MALGTALPATPGNPSTGTIYYVGGTGASDSNAGTDPALPWATIGHAITSMAGNGIALVRPGLYTENLVISTTNTSTTVKTIKAQLGRGTVKVKGKFRLNGATFWRLIDLDLDGSGGEAGVGVKVEGATADCVLNGLTAYRYFITTDADSLNPQGFLQTGTPTRIHWLNCRAHHNGRSPDSSSDHGFYMSQGTACLWANCISHDNAAYGFHFYSSSTVQSSIRDSFIVNCVSAYNRLRGGFLWNNDNAAVPSTLAPGNNRVHNNIAFRNGLSSSGSGYQYGGGGTTVAPDVPNVHDHNWAFGNFSGNVASENPANYVTQSNEHTNDPQMVDPVSADFRPKPRAPGNALGVEIYTPTFDYDNKSRVDPDIGAFVAERTSFMPLIDKQLLAAAGSTGNNTHVGVEYRGNRVVLEFIVEAVGATPTVTFKFQGTIDGVNWYDLFYVTDTTDTPSNATRTVTAVGTSVAFPSSAQQRRWNQIRLVTSANTNVTYRAEMYQEV